MSDITEHKWDDEDIVEVYEDNGNLHIETAIDDSRTRCVTTILNSRDAIAIFDHFNLMDIIVAIDSPATGRTLN